MGLKVSFVTRPSSIRSPAEAAPVFGGVDLSTWNLLGLSLQKYRNLAYKPSKTICIRSSTSRFVTPNTKTSRCTKDSSWILHRNCGIPLFKRGGAIGSSAEQLKHEGLGMGSGFGILGKVWDASSFSRCFHDAGRFGRDVRCGFNPPGLGHVTLLRKQRRHTGDDCAGRKGHRVGHPACSPPCEPASGFHHRSAG